jgi:hypothetical protein
MNIQHILCKSIQPDPKWKYRFDKEDSILSKSLKLKGALSPLVLLQDKNHFVVLDGFKRFQILKDNSASKVPAVLYSVSDAKDGFLHGLLLNETRYPLSTIEKSNVVKIMQTFSDDEGFQSHVYNFLDIPTKGQFIKKYLSINAFPEEAKKYFHKFQFSLRQIERITPISISSLLPWIQLAHELHLKSQEFVNLIEIICDISINKNEPIDKLYKELKINDILKQDSTPQQKSSNLKSYLHEKRYPMLTSIQKEVTDQVNQIQKKSNLPIQVGWDKTLEQTGYWFTIYLESDDSIAQLQNLLESNELGDDLKKLFKIIMHSLKRSNETS